MKSMRYLVVCLAFLLVGCEEKEPTVVKTGLDTVNLPKQVPERQESGRLKCERAVAWKKNVASLPKIGESNLANILVSSRDTPPTDPTSTVASDIVVPPDILAKAELEEWMLDPNRCSYVDPFIAPDKPNGSTKDSILTLLDQERTEDDAQIRSWEHRKKPVNHPQEVPESVQVSKLPISLCQPIPKQDRKVYGIAIQGHQHAAEKDLHDIAEYERIAVDRRSAPNLYDDRIAILRADYKMRLRVIEQLNQKLSELNQPADEVLGKVIWNGRYVEVSGILWTGSGPTPGQVNHVVQTVDGQKLTVSHNEVEWYK